MFRLFYTPEIEKATKETIQAPRRPTPRGFTHAIPLCYPSCTGWRYRL